MTTKKTSDTRYGSRGMSTRVKTAKMRSNSSARWLQRQLNDPYVDKARKAGYRSRAAFKLVELDDKFHLLKPGGRVVDLGCAPGGWSQVAVERVGPTGIVVGCDLLEVPEVAGATLIVQDFLAEEAPEVIKKLLMKHTSPQRGEDGRGASMAQRELSDTVPVAPPPQPSPSGGGGLADVVLSDMAANTTGHTPTDHIRIIYLCELAYAFAREILAPGGAFVCKVLKGGAERELLRMMQKDFTLVKHAKPSASRADSAESYVVATGFRG